MRNYIAVLLVVCAILIAVVVALRPAANVRFEAELSRLDPAEALEKLRAVEGDTAFSDNLELMYGRLLLADGDFDAARRSFRRILAQAGPSADVLETLAGIEIVNGSQTAAADYLRQAYDLSPGSERRGRLGLLYRSLRMTEAERDLLQSVAPARLTDWEIERLGNLLIADGEGDAYEALLRTVADTRDPQALQFRRQLLEFLVESDRAADAVTAAGIWLRNDSSPGATLEESLRSLIGRGALDAAILVARDGFAAVPGEAHRALPVFARAGHGGIARILQAEWLAARQPPLSDAEWNTLIVMAETSGDLRALQGVLLSDEVRAASPDEIGRALLQFLRYRGAGALVPFHHLLTADVSRAAPLVAAAWAGWRGDPTATHARLVAAARGPLTDWDRAIWISVANGLAGTPFYQALLEGGVPDPALQQRLRDSVIPRQSESPPSEPPQPEAQLQE